MNDERRKMYLRWRLEKQILVEGANNAIPPQKNYFTLEPRATGAFTNFQ
jgi:hypothetical protein